MKIAISGWRSEIAVAFRGLLPPGEEPLWMKACEPDLPYADRYFFCHGLLRSKRIEDQTQAEREESWHVNCASVVSACEWIFAGNHKARVAIIGSESAYRGSYDESYSLSKERLHKYVQAKELPYPEQQLVCVSPGIIADAGMTLRRKDLKNLERRKAEHPMKRFVTSAEVAKLAHHLLYEQPYISGTVIRMHGGLK